MLCQCGCGELAPIATQTRSNLGHITGQPIKFINGHNARGRKLSQAQRKSISARSSGARNHWWKDDEVGYRAAHTWVNKQNPKTGVCEDCGKASKRTEYALLPGCNASRERQDYRELCVRCHRHFDTCERQRAYVEWAFCGR